MSNLNKILPVLNNIGRLSVRAMSGEGAGKGGGSGGSIRDAGGAFGKMEAAREDEYFYKKQKQQLESLKNQIKEEISHHEEQLKNHKKILDRHQRRIAEIEADEKKHGKK